MSLSTILHAAAFRDAEMRLRDARVRLDAHLKQDYVAVETRLREEVAHFEAEVKRLEEVVGARVAEFLREGQQAETAVKLAAEGASTVAEREAQRLAEVAKKAREEADKAEALAKQA